MRREMKKKIKMENPKNRFINENEREMDHIREHISRMEINFTFQIQSRDNLISNLFQEYLDISRDLQNQNALLQTNIKKIMDGCGELNNRLTSNE